MKNKHIIIVLGLMAFVFIFPVETQAQRRVVVETPRKTVVVKKTPRTRVVYTHAAPRPRVHTVRTIPRGAVIVTHRGLDYYYHTGRYYRYYGGSYRVVAPPVGVRLATLPVGYRKIFIGPHTFILEVYTI